MNFSRPLSLLVALIALMCFSSACGDSEEPHNSELSSICTEEQLAQPAEDCVVPITEHQITKVSSPEDFQPFCESPCNTVGASFAIRRFDGLTDLSPLSRIESVEGEFFIEENPDLESLEGLESLIYVDHSMYVRSNPKLQNISDLESLREVGAPPGEGGISIEVNPRLISLAGLETLRKAAYVRVNRNDALENIDYFDSLETAKRLVVSGNPNLPTCQAQAVAETIEVTEEVRIEENGAGSCSGA